MWKSRLAQEQTCRSSGVPLLGDRSVPLAVIGITSVGDAGNAADRVRSQGYRVEGLDGDFLCYVDGIIDLDPEVPRGAFDFRIS